MLVCVPLPVCQTCSGKVLIELSGNHFIRGLNDQAGFLRRKFPEVLIHKRSGFLENAKGPNQFRRHRVATNIEVDQGARRLCAVVTVLRHFDFPHTIGFDPDLRLRGRRRLASNFIPPTRRSANPPRAIPRSKGYCGNALLRSPDSCEWNHFGQPSLRAGAQQSREQLYVTCTFGQARFQKPSGTMGQGDSRIRLKLMLSTLAHSPAALRELRWSIGPIVTSGDGQAHGVEISTRLKAGRATGRRRGSCRPCGRGIAFARRAGGRACRCCSEFGFRRVIRCRNFKLRPSPGQLRVQHIEGEF